MKPNTPQAQAKELVDKFTDYGLRNWESAKQCALICCDMMLEDSTVQNIGDCESTSSREQWRDNWEKIKKQVNLIR